MGSHPGGLAKRLCRRPTRRPSSESARGDETAAAPSLSLSTLLELELERSVPGFSSCCPRRPSHPPPPSPVCMYSRTSSQSVTDEAGGRHRRVPTTTTSGPPRMISISRTVHMARAVRHAGVRGGRGDLHCPSLSKDIQYIKWRGVVRGGAWCEEESDGPRRLRFPVRCRHDSEGY